MEFKIKVKRQDNAESLPYWQTFLYQGNESASVADVLDNLNFKDDLFDIEGKPARRIRWECSCLQKMCGACAVRVNGVPALACNFFINTVKGDTIVLEPLSKFPVICDLMVDRSIIQEMLLEAECFYKEKASENPKDHEHRYSVSKCLKCGLCLEACPNYVKGEKFFGAVFANDAFMVSSGNSDNKEIKKQYHRHFENGCSKSLACLKVCPAKIQTLASISGMNRNYGF